jgi:hypothetical protein
LVQELADVAANSPLGTNLMAGELFLTLSIGRTPHLIRALGARTGIEVLLDASVAIPMLVSLLFKPVKRRFSIAARHAHDELKRHGQTCILPLDYLEEVATHLVVSHRDYSDIIDTDPDLAGSENAFVAHYAALKIEGDALTFDEYLDLCGLDNKLRTADFYAARDTLMVKLQRLFEKYSIFVRPLGNQSRASIKRGEEGIARGINELQIKRPLVLMRHDARTLAYLYDQDRTSGIANVLCTWDSLHFFVRNHETAEWQALNPASLGDILSLAIPAEEEKTRVMSPLVVAKTLSEHSTQLAARVWDQLVRIERGHLHDAQLLNQARQFKEEYIKALQEGRETGDVGSAWTRWKSSHYSGAKS